MFERPNPRESLGPLEARRESRGQLQRERLEQAGVVPTVRLSGVVKSDADRFGVSELVVMRKGET